MARAIISFLVTREGYFAAFAAAPFSFFSPSQVTFFAVDFYRGPTFSPHFPSAAISLIHTLPLGPEVFACRSSPAMMTAPGAYANCTTS